MYKTFRLSHATHAVVKVADRGELLSHHISSVRILPVGPFTGIFACHGFPAVLPVRRRVPETRGREHCSCRG